MSQHYPRFASLGRGKLLDVKTAKIGCLYIRPLQDGQRVGPKPDTNVCGTWWGADWSPT